EAAEKERLVQEERKKAVAETKSRLLGLWKSSWRIGGSNLFVAFRGNGSADIFSDYGHQIEISDGDGNKLTRLSYKVDASETGPKVVFTSYDGHADKNASMDTSVEFSNDNKTIKIHVIGQPPKLATVAFSGDG